MAQAQQQSQPAAKVSATQIRLDQARAQTATVLGGHGFVRVVDALVELARATFHHELEAKLGTAGKTIEAVTAPIERAGASAADRVAGGTGTPDTRAVAAGDAVAPVLEQTVEKGKPDAATVAAALAQVLQQLGVVG